jgi:peroxiredoxin
MVHSRSENLMRAGFAVQRPLIVVMALVFSSSLADPASAAKFNRKVDIGKPAPDWKGLQGADGRKHNRDDYKKAKVLVIAFMCNQCYVSQLYEDRLINFVKEFKPQDVALVAVSCSLLPPDRLDKMTERAKKKGFNFDYLTDPSQQIGKEYGATVTPQVFVLDSKRNIAYMGRFDDNIFPDDVHRTYLRDAVRAMLAGKPPDPSETRATGCGIEYGKPNFLLEGSGGE